MFVANIGTMMHAEVYSGSCGESLTWSLNTQDSLLTIEGSGEMGPLNTIPWHDYISYIAHISLPSGLTSIHGGAFSDCINLNSVSIPESVKYIGTNAFSHCSKLTSIVIPNSVISMGSSVLAFCEGLKSAVFSNSMSSISTYTFQGCSNLTSFTIPETVTYIGASAFAGCDNLVLTVPNSVTGFGSYAFSGVCNIKYNGTVTYEAPWGARAMNGYIDGNLIYSDESRTNLLVCFPNATGDVVIPDDVLNIANGAFVGCEYLNSVIIGNRVKSIGNYAFDGCSNLQAIAIPSSVTNIGEDAFVGCTKLHSISVASENTMYDSRNNCNAIIETATNTLMFGCGNTIIPFNISTIGARAFANSGSLTSITIPKRTISIGEAAFSECSSLMSIICHAVTPPALGYDAFYLVDKSIPLYVPAESVSSYQESQQWSEFINIIAMSDAVAKEECNVNYVDKAGIIIDSENFTFSLPIAPEVDGFTFLKWAVLAGDLKDGINVQAIYQAGEQTSAPAVYVNPKNPAQKLIRNGNVYILTEEKVYTITGQEAK